MATNQQHLVNDAYETAYNPVNNENLCTRTTTTTTTTTSNADPCILDTQILESLDGYYAMAMGREMPPVICRLMKECLAYGMKPSLLQEAIDQTTLAPRPSPHYLRAILKRWMDAGIKTTFALEIDRRQFLHRNKRHSKWIDPEDLDLP